MAPALQRSSRQRWYYVLSILFAAVPLTFALIRAVTTGDDLRALWMALSAALAAGGVMAGGKARTRKPQRVLALAAVALVVSTLLAVWMAYAQGATAAPGIWMVGFAFGFCWAASFALDTLSRHRRV